MNVTSQGVAWFFRMWFAPLPLVFLWISAAWGETTTFELDLRELDRHKPATATPSATPVPSRKSPAKKPSRKAAPAASNIDTAQLTRYTVKGGDHIFKILMKEFGMSNDAAERLIPTVTAINKIRDIRKLDVGQVLLLPVGGTTATHHIRKHQPARSAVIHEAKKTDSAPAISPDPAPEQTQEPEPTPAPEPDPLPVVMSEATAPSPVTPETTAPVQAADPSAAPSSPPVVAVAPLPPPRYPVKVHAITGTNGEELVDSIIRALGLEAQRRRVVDLRTGPIDRSAFSIKVDRYIDHGGKRIIVNCTDKDQYNYTLLRLLEQEGYRVIHAERTSFRELAGALLTHLDKPHMYSTRQTGEASGTKAKEMHGYLVGDGMEDVQLFLAEPDSSLK